ncbi:hypothetical protein BU24DRAFT_404473 [Aaosphaeria arxii CBS 175.79]|uniref:Uncharacterized protein n=1 Tax=Aaosphaeria arxii CBS 175.79 TaxID=1450172 RepID=A0A6A5YA38_9PLEO|nr:uncharacterized protein BU24DRAFT_404473 [Aaosphaeria arxii CBS 175.79]KAF2021464.1 hypothetical protein BU24DRAFT_404473 [Aaosphaeria arxii CBS 175.79]
MYLLQLPPELIMEIFSYVGSGYFRWNMSRLSVCRQWYYFARLACFQDLYISQYILDRLARSPYLQENLCSIEESVEHLDLLLPSYEEERNRIARQRGHWCIASSSPDATGWASEQNANLARLAAAIKHSNRLRSLRICSLPVRPVKGVFDQLLNSADLFRNELLPFLTAGNLTCLDLDLWRDRDILRKTEREYGHGHHLCTMISKHLSTLRRLRVRMQPICPDVLKIKEENNKLRLSDVVINIIGTDRSPFEDGVRGYYFGTIEAAGKNSSDPDGSPENGEDPDRSSFEEPRTCAGHFDRQKDRGA